MRPPQYRIPNSYSVSQPGPSIHSGPSMPPPQDRIFYSYPGSQPVPSSLSAPSTNPPQDRIFYSYPGSQPAPSGPSLNPTHSRITTSYQSTPLGPRAPSYHSQPVTHQVVPRIAYAPTTPVQTFGGPYSNLPLPYQQPNSLSLYRQETVGTEDIPYYDEFSPDHVPQPSIATSSRLPSQQPQIDSSLHSQPRIANPGPMSIQITLIPPTNPNPSYDFSPEELARIYEPLRSMYNEGRRTGGSQCVDMSAASSVAQ